MRLIPSSRLSTIISLLQDSLTRSTDPNTRGKFFEEISSAYDGIELPMEAFDAAERAIGESPQNGQFRRYLDSLCYKHNNRLRSEKAL